MIGSKRISNLILSLLVVTMIQAQQHYPQCGHQWVLQQNESLHSGYIDKVHESFDFIKSQVSNAKSESNFEIKVVVHVVHANDEQNIDDDRVRAVLNVVNEDFSGDFSIDRGLRQIFHPVLGNSGIKFKLEEIIRHRTQSTFSVDLLSGTLPDDVKRSQAGGSDAWDTDEYLNIWVCDIQFELGTLLGYAYPPLCAPNWPDGSTAPSPELDGVVMDYIAMDTAGTIEEMGQTFRIRGHALTHEIGHYLGLRHIWGDGNGVIFGTPDCTVDDGIDDTPNQGLPSQGSCDTLANTCVDASNDLPDMIENFMDYSDERCLNSFTAQQVAVMHATLENCRMNILSSSEETTTSDLSVFDVYPNPSSGAIVCKSEYREATQLEVYTILGKRIRTFEFQGTVQKIMLNDLDNGLYYIILKDSENRSIGIKKIILRK